MIAPDAVAFVFESGVVRFDDDGVLYVHLRHGPGDPHPLLIHEAEAGLTVPGRTSEIALAGTVEEGAWRSRSRLPETADLPEGLVLRFTAWSWAQVEMSGDLTVYIEGPKDLPLWARMGHVHRLAREGESVSIWTDSAEPPSVPSPAEQARLEDPMEDWAPEHAAPTPEPTGRWMGGHREASTGCVIWLAAGLLGGGLVLLG